MVIVGKPRNKDLYSAVSHADGSVSEMTSLHDDHTDPPLKLGYCILDRYPNFVLKLS